MYDARSAKRIMVAAGSAVSLTGTGLAAQDVVYIEPSRIWRLVAYVTTTVVSTAKVQVQCLYRPVKGSSSGQVIVGTIFIGATAAVDSAWYVDITPYNLPAGSQVVFNVSVAAAGGGAAGAAIVDIVEDFDPEAVANESKFNLASS